MPSSDTILLAILAAVVIATTLAAATTTTNDRGLPTDYCEINVHSDAELVWVVEQDGHELACQHPDGTLVDIPSEVTQRAAA